MEAFTEAVCERRSGKLFTIKIKAPIPPHTASRIASPRCCSVRSETKLNTAFHRLPIWLVTVPSSTNLVPCLWASTHYDTDDFQIEASLKEEGGYYKYSNITTPCFVNSIGEGIDADAVFFSSDHDNEEPLYICAVNDRVTVIGRYIDEEISNFRDQVFFTSHRDEVPEWLDAHPVQRLLQLTSDLDEASAFALSPRIFTKESAFSRRSWGWAACLRHVCVTSASPQ